MQFEAELTQGRLRQATGLASQLLQIRRAEIINAMLCVHNMAYRKITGPAGFSGSSDRLFLEHATSEPRLHCEH
jgi:hypothetical protein